MYTYTRTQYVHTYTVCPHVHSMSIHTQYVHTYTVCPHIHSMSTRTQYVHTYTVCPHIHSMSTHTQYVHTYTVGPYVHAHTCRLLGQTSRDSPMKMLRISVFVLDCMSPTAPLGRESLFFSRKPSLVYTTCTRGGTHTHTHTHTQRERTTTCC